MMKLTVGGSLGLPADTLGILQSHRICISCLSSSLWSLVGNVELKVFSYPVTVSSHLFCPQGTGFFDSLLQKLQVTYQFKLEDYMDGLAIRSKPLRKMVRRFSSTGECFRSLMQTLDSFHIAFTICQFAV